MYYKKQQPIPALFLNAQFVLYKKYQANRKLIRFIQILYSVLIEAMGLL